MSVILIGILMVSSALLVIGCGTGSFATVTPSANEPTIELTTNPEPPSQGQIQIIVNVKDANGQPLVDADVFVSGNHTDMAGMTMNGKATAQGNGRYALKTDFGMNGNWKIQVQVKKPPLNAVKQFELKLQ